MTYLPKGRRTQHVGANRCAQSRPGTSWQRWECKQTGRSPNAYPVGRSYDVIIQTGRTGRRLFFHFYFVSPSFSVPLFGLPPACRLALSVYLQRILFWVFFLSLFCLFCEQERSTTQDSLLGDSVRVRSARTEMPQSWRHVLRADTHARAGGGVSPRGKSPRMLRTANFHLHKCT